MLNISCTVPEGSAMPERDSMFDTARRAIQATLTEASGAGTMLITMEGWPLKGTEYDYEVTGMDPYIAYCVWKMQQAVWGKPWTEHSTHPVWSLEEGGNRSSSYDSNNNVLHQ